MLAEAELDILRPELTREDVLARVDPDLLRSGPFNLQLSTALAISSPDAAATTEDLLLRYTEALNDPNTSLAAHAKLAAEIYVMTTIEYHAATSAYAEGDTHAPVRSEWKNPQHYLEAMKIHERRMDRLLRARKDAVERFEKAAEIFRRAALTRDGLDLLRDVTVGRVVTAPNEPKKIAVTCR